MEVNTRHSQKIIVYWDGKCPLCSEIKAKFIGFDSEHRLVFLDFRNPDVARSASSRFSPAQLADEMRVQMPDGTWRTGFFAWAEILRAMPLLKWLGAMMKSWIFADIGPKAYRWVADHRFALSRLFHLPEPCGPDGTCRIGSV